MQDINTVQSAKVCSSEDDSNKKEQSHYKLIRQIIRNNTNKYNKIN